jgi:flagellar basal-body rod modification protein FlgD
MSNILPFVDTPLVTGQPTPAAPTQEPLGQETFLRLLTEQLQNQDPLDPMKNEDFVAQLAQFSSLEQLVGLQSTMEAVYLGIASMNNATMANLLGTEVVALGDTFRYDGAGDQVLHFDAAASFDSATVTITNSDGKVVDTIEIGGHGDGEFTVAWDGQDLDGQPLPEGEYTFTISATTAEGTSVEVDTLVVGIVDEMDYSTGMPQPSIDGVSVSLDSIVRLTSGEPTEEMP